jgi:hypothetical protein
MTCKQCNKKIHASGLCRTHWKMTKYGICINECSQPSDGKSGLCSNCKKRGGKPNSRRDGLCNKCNAKLVNHRCVSCDINRKKNENLKRNYGISLQQWNDMFEKQNNSCKICNTKESRHFVVDHDHYCCPGRKTCGNCTRGIICENCNRVLGSVKDSKDLLKNMINYLGQ